LLAERGLERCVLMGNIPYHHTRDVLFSFLVDEAQMIEAACLMVQKEVADRLVSPPGSRVYGVTSVILQSIYSARTVFKVLPGSFFPRPRVTSAVVEFKHLETPVVAAEEFKPFFGLVKSLFQQRRKTIQASLKAQRSLSAPELREIESTSNIDLKRRAEQLSIEEFLQLSRAVTGVTA
jgi:16S rRNA (adenine1518-N6/adenine1519-N6)-dimethyltransferase